MRARTARGLEARRYHAVEKKERKTKVIQFNATFCQAWASLDRMLVIIVQFAEVSFVLRRNSEEETTEFGKNGTDKRFTMDSDGDASEGFLGMEKQG